MERSSRSAPQASAGAGVCEGGPGKLALQVLEKLQAGFGCSCCAEGALGAKLLSGTGSMGMSKSLFLLSQTVGCKAAAQHHSRQRGREVWRQEKNSYLLTQPYFYI